MNNKLLSAYISLVLLIVIFALGDVKAQDTVYMSLSSAVDSAMVNNSQVRRFKQAVIEKEYMSKASVGNFFPSVDVVGGFTYFSANPEINMSQVKESVDDMFGKYGAVIAKELNLSDESQEAIYNKIVGGMGKLPAYNIIIDQQNYPNLNVVATQPLFMGGKIIAGKKFADAELFYANEELRKVSNDVVKETVERYFGVVLLQQVVEVRKQVVKGMKRHERQAVRAIEIGVIPKHELLRAQVAVANAERDLTDDENKLELAKMALHSSLGLPDTVDVVVTDSLKFKLIPTNLDDVRQMAYSQQPIFKMIDQKKVMVQQKHAVELSEFMPQIAAWGQYSAFRSEYPVIMPPFMVGIQAHINIFHGMQKFNKLKSTRYLAQQVELADEYAHEQINLWVNKSWRDATYKKERYIKMKPSVELARKNLEINEKRFEEGLGKSIDVIDARLLYEGAELERLKSLFDYYLALTDLYLATGAPQKAVELLSTK
jgi:outer membrane protein TolC